MATAEGIVPGAGHSWLRAIEAVEHEVNQHSGDERIGTLILRRALAGPTRQIAGNPGADGGVVVERMREVTDHHGSDTSNGRDVDLIEAGIIDPTNVIRVALENAISVASTFQLTEAMVMHVPEPKAEAAAPSMPSNE